MELKEAIAGSSRSKKTIRLLLRGDLAAKMDEMDERLRQAVFDDSKSNKPDTAPAIAAEIVDFQEEIESQQVSFTVQSIGARRWSDLLLAHPPTDEQKAEGLDCNMDSFQPAAVEASLIDPKPSNLDEVVELQDALSLSQWSMLALAVIEVNVGTLDLPKSPVACELTSDLGSR